MSVGDHPLTRRKAITLGAIGSAMAFDKAAIDAVKQWRYAPLLLNGTAHPFILTVTVSFNLG